jgi:hypothetical protein
VADCSAKDIAKRIKSEYSQTVMPEDRTKLALLISASLIAAVRTAREEIKPSPKIISAVADSVRLARMVLEKVQRE